MCDYGAHDFFLSLQYNKNIILLLHNGILGGGIMKKVFKANLFALILITIQVLSYYFAKDIFLLLHLNVQSAIIFTQLAFLIVPIALYFIITREPIKETLKIKKLSFIDAVIIIGIGILCQPIVMFLSLITSLFSNNAVGEILTSIGDIPLYIKLTVFAITPAICEELAVRGIILSGYKDKKIRDGAIMTGIIFAILHMNLQQSLYAFLLGVLFAYLVYITKSIFASMLCHFTVNGLQVYLSHIISKSYAAASNTPIEGGETAGAILITAIPLLVIGAICAVLVLLLLKLLVNRNKHKVESIINYEESSEKIINWPFLALVALYIFQMVKDVFAYY